MIYAISDIHGKFDAFIALLSKVRFSEKDTLYIVGDAIDRGAQSLELLEYIFSRPNIIYLMGNHEEMMHTWLDDKNLNDTAWLRNGGEAVWTQIKNHGNAYLDALNLKLKTLPKFAEITVDGNSFVLGHACIADVRDSGLTLWGKHYDNWGLKFGPHKYGVVGHTETYRLTAPNKILKRENVFYIDCGACFGYSLGILNLNSLKRTYIKTGPWIR